MQIQRTIVALGIGFALSTSAAVDQTAQENVVFEKRTTITLEGEKIIGEVQGPNGILVDSRRPSRFKHLLKIRTDFAPELLSSGSNL